jgi:hypothetical protein
LLKRERHSGARLQAASLESITTATAAVSNHRIVMPSLVPGIHVFAWMDETWMAGTSPAMTREKEL